MTTLELPKELDFQTLASAIGALTGGLTGVTAIDLQQLRWVQPSGIAGLAALTSVLQETRELAWVNARETPAFRYLQNMDFFRQFGVFPDEDFERRDENRAFARLARIDWETESSLVAKNLAKVIEHHASPIYNDLFTCVEESIRNVIDHAAAPGYAVAQSMELPGGDRSYRIAICDPGRGIRAVMADDERYRGLDDRRALDMACQKGVTSKRFSFGATGDPTNFGLGLYHIDRIATTTLGTFVLCSGSTARIREGDRVRYEAIAPWQGTSVEISLYLSGFRNILSKKPRTGRIRFE